MTPPPQEGQRYDNYMRAAMVVSEIGAWVSFIVGLYQTHIGLGWWNLLLGAGIGLSLYWVAGWCHKHALIKPEASP